MWWHTEEIRTGMTPLPEEVVLAESVNEIVREGQKVSYEIGQDRRTGKSKAENVRAI